jgi:hypothetical protein
MGGFDMTEDGVLEQAREASGIHDFDFLEGAWVVEHRRLKHRLARSDEWERFSGTNEMRLMLGGAANMDDNVLNAPEGAYRAASIRAFEAGSRKWSIWWLDGRHPGELDPPVVGVFCDGVGVFFGEATWNGKAIQVRFTWSEAGSASPRWEQAFSLDGGKTWETNWFMDFRRAS